MAEGLSRRRVGGASSSTTSDDDPRPMGSRSDSFNAAVTPTRMLHAGSAFEGGSKVAFDPQELEREAEEFRSIGRMPKLTLMEEVLLLGLKDREGYLSFWNDNISYALRGCILLELAFRRRIAIVKDPLWKRFPLTDRHVEVIDSRPTGETLLDEALKLMKSQENATMSVNSWIDLLSGETWNVMKIGFQLKQVRERLAKGLVDKGVLRTEKRNFLLFDMATHPVADARTKESIVSRCIALLTSNTTAVPEKALLKEGENCRITRSMCLVCCAYAANVVDNALGRLGYEEREAALQRCDDTLAEFACWPFGTGLAHDGTGVRRKREASRIGVGSSNSNTGRESVRGLLQAVKDEMQTSGAGAGGGEDYCFQVVAAVLDVLSKLDSLL